ncbi:MAG: hypothetical protein ABII74_02200 [Elusimicrobiota bacterium]
MNMKLFDRKRLVLKSLKERRHDLDLSALKNPDKSGFYPDNLDKRFKTIARRIIEARRTGASVIMMIGAHVIRAGVQKYIIEMIENNFISCIAMNGAGMIHDYEFALIGATTENVANYIKEGQFGLWEETGCLNDIIKKAYHQDKNIGMGAAVGDEIERLNLPHRDVSILAAAWRHSIPVTVHVGIGYDIIHEHPNCDGAATGALSYNDFLIFASEVAKLEHGVVMNFGSSVMAPEIFLKALSMARNVARQEEKIIRHFSTLVCDLYPLTGDFRKEPLKGSPAYFFRPWKTMLVRTVSEGGESFYIQGDHRETVPALWAAIKAAGC